MRTRLPLLPITLLLTGGLASAQTWDDTGPWYVSLGLGLNTIEESEGFDPDDGFAFHGALGYHLGEPGDGRFRLSVEAEYYYSENDVEDFPIAFGLTPDDLETSILFANLVGDWYWTDSISLYLGGGIGYVTDVELFGASDDGGTAAQGKAGLRYQLGSGFSWNLGYRFVMTEDIDDANDFENQQHVFETGMSWDL